jgi:hypothetical protein
MIAWTQSEGEVSRRRLVATYVDVHKILCDRTRSKIFHYIGNLLSGRSH